MHANETRDRSGRLYRIDAAAKECELAAKHGAKVSISYQGSTARRIFKFRSQTFAGMLSSLGNKHSYAYVTLHHIFLRWNYWTLHRNESFELGGHSLLGVLGSFQGDESVPSMLRPDKREET